MRCNLKSKRIRTLLLSAAIGFIADELPACGPDFPNYILEGGGDQVLAAPRTDFYRELDRLHLAPHFRAVISTNHYAEQNISLEQADLLAALKKTGADDFDAALIAAQHLAERIKLLQFNAAFKAWSNSAPEAWDQNAMKYVRGQPVGPPPKFPVVNIVAGLPEEFGDYFDGAIGWSSPLVLNQEICRRFWERVLELPPAQRHYKSVAAAFMLGKSWAQEDPDTAAGYFQQVRALAKSGFADSTGLAAASLGEEARLDLARKQFAPAIDLYLEQFATGDPTAANSLQFAVERSLQGDLWLNELAADPQARRVVTAYMISRGAADTNWLAAMEAAGVQEAGAAEEFALAAYQAGQWTLAQRWIDRAPDSPAAQWLQAKLLLRAGKTDEAAALLAIVSRSFPVESPAAIYQHDQALTQDRRQRQLNLPLEPPATNAPATLADDLSVAGYDYFSFDLDAPSQVLGELGVLHLARREYTESLDALLCAGFWMDAAYVAERVLTADELKTYVDGNWTTADASPDLWNHGVAWEQGSFDPCREIRYLLARRLTRLDRGPEAGAYYPVEWRAAQAALVQDLAAGRDVYFSPVQRFYALVSAARIARTNGMELIGTELEPDWHIDGGDFETGLSASSRHEGLFPASKDELNRAAQNVVRPEERFHYRAQAILLKQEAARLAWEAVQQMPDNSDEAARMLSISGAWLDQKFATACYQTILRRFGKTEIGAEAGRTGDLPTLDANGRVFRRKYNAEDNPVPGKSYLVHAGDTLFHIARIAGANGQPMTVADIIQFNHGLTADRIRAGRVIDIPGSDSMLNALPPPVQESNNPAANNQPDAGPDNRPVAGQTYIIHSGDSLPKIAREASAYGRQISARDILDANPGMTNTQLRVGQKILIPETGN